jgi:hypothetical protein
MAQSQAQTLDWRPMTITFNDKTSSSGPFECRPGKSCSISRPASLIGMGESPFSCTISAVPALTASGVTGSIGVQVNIIRDGDTPWKQDFCLPAVP